MIGLLCVLFAFQLGTMFMIDEQDRNNNCEVAMIFNGIGMVVNGGAIIYFTYCTWHAWYYFPGVC